MRNIFVLLLSSWPLATLADDLPPPLPLLYDVTDVAADDRLNIRAAPDGAAEIRGSLSPDATRIEITALSLQGNWGRMNHLEGTGWVAMRFLQPHPVTITASGLPEGLQCFGTEPFWSVTVNDDATMLMSTPEREETYTIIEPPRPTTLAALSEYGVRFRWAGWNGPVTTEILPGRCSDQMSDRAYGLHYFDESQRRGCCMLR